VPLRLPDPGTFEHLLEEVRVPADGLVRLSKFPATEPYWSRGRYRFDGPAAGPNAFGTCYAANDLAVAFAESVIHQAAWFKNGHYEVLQADIDQRHIIQLSRPRAPELTLADLTGENLKVLGLNNDISSGDDYALSMAWAKGIHDANPKWDGLLYISRQRHDAVAVAVFERSGVRKKTSRKLAGKVLDELCNRYGVVVV
jgi:hypothetical protein